MLPIDWRSAYPVLWYVHAVLGAAFVAYLPFGKLRHIFNVPLTYLIEEIYGVKRGERV
jgi:nitrate reductase gamma subunit